MLQKPGLSSGGVDLPVALCETGLSSGRVGLLVALCETGIKLQWCGCPVTRL